MENPVEIDSSHNNQKSAIDDNKPPPSNFLDEAPIGKSANNKFTDLVDDGIDLANTLEGKLKSDDPKIRCNAYTDLIVWNDTGFTPAIFAKGLHLTVKEKDSNVIDKILTAIESLMEKHPSDFATVDMKKFLLTFTEFLLNNVKGTAKEHATQFIIHIWEKNANKTEFTERIKEMIATVKMKLQEKALFMVLELLKAGKMEELQLLKPLYPELEKQIVSRTVPIKTLAFEIYKEAFLWIGEGLKAFTTGLKDAQNKELDVYMKSVDPKQMKSLKKEDGSGPAKKFDVYETFAEAELPKKYNEDEFADEVMAQTKWNERKRMLDELNSILEKTPKINRNTNAFIYLNLAKRIFQESNIAVQVSIIRTLGFLAAGMRKAFFTVAKTMFPILLCKFKEKNRQLSEEILQTLEKFFFVLTFEETSEEIEENLKDKNPEKKLNILNLIFVINDKLDKIKTVANSIKVVRIVVRLIDENDSAVREKASELIAKQLDLFEDKINPLLKDLPSQKMAKIIKYRQKMSNILVDETVVGKNTGKESDAKNKNDDKETDNEKNAKLKRNIFDKAQMIAKIREEVFSNKKVKLSEIRSFSIFLFSSLSQLIELTKEFKEITPVQANEIFLFIDEITQKVEKQAFQEDSRKLIAQFYIEQLLGKSSDELNQSIDRYINCPNRIMVPRTFLQDLLNVLNKKPVKVSKELLTLILSLYEDEVQTTNKLSVIPHNPFVEFLKLNFSVPNIHVSMKLPLIQTMRIVATKFGEKATNEFPQVLFKELSSQNTDLQKMFEKTYEKLVSPDAEKNKAAINDLNSCEDHSRMNYFWSKSEFLSFLRNQLNSDGRVYPFGQICQVVSNYLLTKVESPMDFKIKNYLSIFQTVLAIHYNQDSEMKRGETDKILNQTVDSLTAPLIMNEMISDNNLSQNKLQILNFFFQFSYAIEPNLKLINYLNNIIDPKGPSPEIQPLLDLVLLIIKNTNNDEVIIKGSENRYIRDVWQKLEIDLLLNENLVRGSKVFEDQTTFNMIKNFLMANLKLEDIQFHNYDLERVVFGTTDIPLKMRLAYYFIRSVENIRQNCLFIMAEIASLKNTELSEEEALIALKTLFNILRNLVYMQGQDVFRKGRDCFVDMLTREMDVNDFPNAVDFNTSDHSFFVMLVNKQEVKYLSTNLESENLNNVSDLSFVGQLANERHFATGKPKVNQLRIEEPYSSQQGRVLESPIANKSARKRNLNQMSELSKQPKSFHEFPFRNNEIREAKNRQTEQMASVSNNDISYVMSGHSLESPELLQQQFDKMLTFDLAEFQDASLYFEELCKSGSPSSQQFLCAFANDIVSVFVSVCSMIFEGGINYELDRESYELIFSPLQLLFVVDDFLRNLQSKTLSILTNQVLFRLVISNEEKTINTQHSENQKVVLAEFMIKFWNSLMLRIIEKTDQNGLINALFGTVMELTLVNDDPVQTGVFNLAMRCLSKVSKNLKNIIQTINVSMVLSLASKFIQNYGVQNSDSVGSKTVKSIISELVTNCDFQEIWICYDQTFGDDGEQIICKWIRFIQNKMAEGRLIEMIQQCENRGTSQSASDLIDFFAQMRDVIPNLEVHNFAEHFKDPGFFEHIIKEMPPGQINPRAFAKTKPVVTSAVKLAKDYRTPVSRSNNDIGPNRNGRVHNQKRSVDKFKKSGNIDTLFDKSELSNYSEVSDVRDNQKRNKR